MACLLPDDRESAVREVSRVYELIKAHYPLLLHQGMQEPQATTQLLLGEALRALNIALSVMKQQQQETGSTTASLLAVKLELSTSSPATSASNGATTSTSARSGKRIRSAINGGKSLVTPFPFVDDGHVWRKYGEKRINGTHFTRSYFRCSYKDEKGCLATKYVQQKDNSDPPEFQVIYNNDHTCNCNNNNLPSGGAGINNPPVGHVQNEDNSDPPRFQVTYNNDHIWNCNNNLPTGSGDAINNPPIGHDDVMIINQQEATAVQPPLAHVSAAPLDYLMSCHESFMITDQYVTIGATGDNPCIPGVSCDELDIGPIMTEPQIGDTGLIMTEQLLMGDDPEYHYQDPDLQAVLADLTQELK